MNRLPQNDLFPSERPVRSDYARETTISYARRRQITVAVLVTLLALGAYAIWGGGSSTSKEVPVIAGESEYKQKPADPGGIDIPHQDVRVYDQLEGKSGAKPVVEHLLPGPEAPKETSQPATAEAPSPAAAPVTGVSPKSDLDPSVAVKPVETTVNVAPAAAPSPTPNVAPPPSPAPSVASAPNVAAASVAAEAPKASLAVKVAPAATPKAPALTIEQIIANTKSSASAKAAPVASTPSSGGGEGDYAIQLASIANEAQAKDTAAKLASKYSGELGGAKLRVVRADLGAQGVYYRIRSDGLSKDEANRICSSLKRVNTGCILVGK